MRNRLFLVILFALFSACAPEAEPIGFGKEECDFCKMTIVDREHAAQMVTKKGKQIKYDSIECMLNDLSEEKELKEMAILMVSNYGKSEMVPAKKSTYLICEKIKSPMGAFLSAYSTQSEAEKTLNELGGKMYSWEEILTKYGVE